MGVLFNDVVINKLSGGLGRRTPNQDMVSGLLFNSTNNAAGKIEKDKVYRLASVKDAESLGIDESYDTGGVSAYYQISQFFRMNPSGDLFIMRSEETDYPTLIENRVEEMLLKAEGAIRQLAIIHSVGNFVETKNAIAKSKTVTKNAFENHRPVEIILEGKGFDVKAPLDLKELDAENVSVVIAMDKELAIKGKYFVKGTSDEYTLKENEEALIAANTGDVTVTFKNEKGEIEAVKDEKDDLLILEYKVTYENTAAVGVLLGAVSKAKVSENVAWVEKFNLTGDGFQSVGLINGQELVTEGQMKTLDEFKYIFTRKHTGVPGVYFNDSHTCTKPTSDFTYIEANRTINKAARIARTALLPKLNSPVLVDSDTGKLAPSVVKGFETLCRAALERMISNEEVSEIDVLVNPSQDILANSTLEIQMSIVPMGTARRIIVNLGFKNPFQLSNSSSSSSATAPTEFPGA